MKVVRLQAVEAIIGAKIKGCDEQSKAFPFDHYNRGARDAMVNLLKAMRILWYAEKLQMDGVETPDIDQMIEDISKSS